MSAYGAIHQYPPKTSPSSSSSTPSYIPPPPPPLPPAMQAATYAPYDDPSFRARPWADDVEHRQPTAPTDMQDYENGRRYHCYRAGAYMYPNDDVRAPAFSSSPSADLSTCVARARSSRHLPQGVPRGPRRAGAASRSPYTRPPHENSRSGDWYRYLGH
jgi:hypothetical protein